MPLSNHKGEGFENKIAQVVGKALGTGVQYYWRPSIERGLMRTTLSEGNCDLWMDMASDTEGAVVLPNRCIARPSCSRIATTRASTSRVSTIRAQESARRRVPGLGHPRGAVRARRRQQHGDPLSQSQRRRAGGQSALLSGAASDRRHARRRRGVGTDGGLLQDHAARAAGHQARQLDEERGADGIRHDARRPARTPGHQGGRRGRARATQGRGATDSRRLRRAAGQMRRMPGIRRSALARAVQPSRQPPRDKAADRREASRAHGRSEEMAGRRARIRTTNLAMPSSPTTSIACAICSRTAPIRMRATARATRR